MLVEYMDTSPYFIKIGHRGAAGHEPENTLASFQKAIELGVDMIEFDVHCCKSGEIVVIHDDALERTTNGIGCVKSKTLAELKMLDAGKRQCIPTAGEVLALVGQKVAVNIELKGAATALPVAELIYKHVRKGWSRDQFLVSSFDYKELRRFRIFDRFSRAGLLFEEPQGDIFGLADGLGCYSINPPVELTTARLVNEAHVRGLKVFVWTANSPAEIQKLKTMKVDGIFSDFPDRLAT